MMTPNISGERIDRLFYRKETPILEVKIAFPQIMGHLTKKCEDAFNRCYRDGAKRLNSRAGGECRRIAEKDAAFADTQEFPFTMHSLIHTYNVGYLDQRYVSLFFDLYRYWGGTHGTVTRRGHTWDLSLGKRVALPYFFKERSSYKKIITDEIRRQIDCQRKEGIPFFRDPQNLAMQRFSLTSFYMTDSAIEIFYPLYSIAPYYGGIRSFSIHFDALDSCWQKERRPQCCKESPVGNKTEHYL